MAFVINVESPLQNDVRALIGELNAALLALTAPELCSHLTVEQMARADTTVWVAREDDVAVACGALRRHDGRIGEVKRMYTRPEYRGRQIGGRILAEIETMGRAESLRELVLETGDRHHAAWVTYERAGFARCGPVLDYPGHPTSVFYRKSLLSEAP